jgi:hypothetical protein
MADEKWVVLADIDISQAIEVYEITAREAQEDERVKSEQQGSGGALEVITPIYVACMPTRVSYKTDLLW